MSAELRTYLAALRGALQWHIETGDAALPVPQGFKMPPLGAAAARKFPAPKEAPRAAVAPPAPPVAAPVFVPLPAGTDRAAALAALEAESVGGVVTGRGGAHPAVVFLGEAPAPDVADAVAATEMLERMVAAMKLPAEQVHVCQVSWKGPGEPTPDDFAAARAALDRRLAILQPRVVVAFGLELGRWLAGNPRLHIAQLREHWHQYGGVPLRVTFHPALLLRNPDLKRPVWDDLKAVMRRLAAPPDRR